MDHPSADPALATPEAMPLESFLRPLGARLCHHLATAVDPAGPVVRLASPAQLAEAFAAAGVPLALDGDVPPATTAQLHAAVEVVLRYSVNTAHPHFLNQLYGHCDAVGLGADWLTSALNTNGHTYEVAPVFTAVEKAVLHKLARVLGPAYDLHEGFFVPGGAIANLYGMLLARARAVPDVRTNGVGGGPRLVAFVSDQAHYSYLKSAIVLGIGTDHLVAVPTDGSGAMVPAELRKAVAAARAAGHQPFFVGATAGTTVTGAFDPLRSLAEVCREEGLWLHVDGAWGGPVLFSGAHRTPWLEGIELTDSVTLDAHKLLSMPIQCACFIAKGTGKLKASHSTCAGYLFQPDKLNLEHDLGDLTIQCGRRNDALKWWLSWHSVGDRGLACRVDRSAALCRYWANKIEADPRFRLAVPFVLLNVCFWYLPAALRAAPEIGPAEAAQLHPVAPLLKARLQQDGGVLLAVQVAKGLPNFFRAVVPGSFAVTTTDVDGILATLAALGEELAP